MAVIEREWYAAGRGCSELLCGLAVVPLLPSRISSTTRAIIEEFSGTKDLAPAQPGGNASDVVADDAHHLCISLRPRILRERSSWH
jgi:hypothetical protein